MNATEAIEDVLDRHSWRGGYFCQCGHELNSAGTWARHLAALLDEMGAVA